MKRQPILEMLPSFSLPPLEFCFGTSPIQAGKQRSDLNACASAMVATNDLASNGPTLGLSTGDQARSYAHSLEPADRSRGSVPS